MLGYIVFFAVWILCAEVCGRVQARYFNSVGHELADDCISTLCGLLLMGGIFLVIGSM